MYTFELRARYNGKILPVVASEIVRVESHYLLSNFALSIYVFLFFAGLFLAIFIPTQQQKKEKHQILKAKKKADSEVKNLKQENYQIQLDFKNKELASSTMHILQKNELINNVKDRISEIKSKVKDPAARKELRNLETRLKNDQLAEQDWEDFAIHFTKVHHDFFKKIKTQHPELTPKDLKLCSYLKLNLTTKEIAPLLGISIRGVEVARYRLRKKLKLDSEENLNEYMMNL
jgi:DNA-binding CsgD family transcriptional regulator